jgi:hypothetical protein
VSGGERIKARSVSSFSIEVIKCEFSGRSAVHSSAWLDAFVAIELSRISPASAQAMEAENEKAADDQEDADACNPDPR